MRGSAAVLALALVAGCAVTDAQYPGGWDPLLPAAAADCTRFAGSYADRGEAPHSPVQPSLSFGLFGHHSVWRSAQRVEFAFPHEGTLEITVRDATQPLLRRTLSANAGEFSCRDGRLVVRSRRWVAGDIVAGREDVTIEFHDAPGRLVARVQERAYGTMFAVVPIAGTAVHWYRFPKASP